VEIRTQGDWWAAVDSHWSNILDIFDRCGAPMSRGPEGLWWSDGIGLEPVIHEKTMIRTLEDAKAEKDHETLHSFFEKAWMAAPDSSYIHGWPSWGMLCDLCSEYWVFQPEEVK
jgi:hypothetical protein